jgi:hypothetical protein
MPLENWCADERVSRGQAIVQAVCVCESVSVEKGARRPPLPASVMCPPGGLRRRRLAITAEGSALQLFWGSALQLRWGSALSFSWGSALRLREGGPCSGYVGVASLPARAVPSEKGLEETCPWLRKEALTSFLPQVTKLSRTAVTEGS